jgi:3-oxoacyl-[acyl-carrier-protein] synthase-3
MMNGRKRAEIVGTGSAVPDRILTNQDLVQMVETSDEWIVSRSGIRERHITDDQTTTSDLAALAARRALEEANISAEELDLIIIGTATPDMIFPSTACLVQDLIGAKNAAPMDLVAACSGFIYAITVANAFISSGQYKTVLSIGAETLSKFTDYQDRNTCVLFGDAAGAVVMRPTEEDRGVLETYLGGDGHLWHLLHLPAGGTRLPASHETVDQRLHFIKMSGNEVFKSAVKAMGDAALKVLQQAGLTGEDVDLLIPHQANIRIINATAKRIKLPLDKVYVNIDRYGNTSAASIPLAMDEARKARPCQPGDVWLLVAFGGGFTWGSALIRW